MTRSNRKADALNERERENYKCKEIRETETEKNRGRQIEKERQAERKWQKEDRIGEACKTEK